MQITRFDIHVVEIPMRMTVQHALAERKTAVNVIVSAHDADGRTGWGESCPRPYVTGETVDSVKKDLVETILPALLGRSLGDFGEAQAALIEQLDGLARNQQAAFCAAELAVLDLLGKATGQSAGDVLGPVIAPEVAYSGVIAAEEPEAVKKHCGFMKQFGATNVKVKVGASLEANMMILTIARKVLGDDVPLRLDANAAWSADEAVRQLEAMAAFNLEGVEQPVAGEDIAAMKQVTAAKLVPVVADESLCSMADAEQLINEAACDIFNVRISKCGGLINSGRIYQRAVAAGLRSQLGAQVGETGLLSAAGRHLATRCEDIVWREGSYGGLLLEEDITEPDITIGPGGRAPALESPGLGVEPDPTRFEKHLVETIPVS